MYKNRKIELKNSKKNEDKTSELSFLNPVSSLLLKLLLSRLFWA